MTKYRDLVVWRRAHELTVLLHRAFPSNRARHSPGLRQQLLRACGSIAANIAEGTGQSTNIQFARFLDIAIASASETENHLELAVKLKLLVATTLDPLDEIQQIRRMLYGLQRAVKSRSDSRRSTPEA